VLSAKLLVLVNSAELLESFELRLGRGDSGYSSIGLGM